MAERDPSLCVTYDGRRAITDYERMTGERPVARPPRTSLPLQTCGQHHSYIDPETLTETWVQCSLYDGHAGDHKAANGQIWSNSEWHAWVNRRR